jgi:uncharacterized protein
MPFIELALLTGGALIASLASGASGFAFALIALPIWLQFMEPARAVPLVVICSMLLNLALIWRLWSTVSLPRLAPFLAGALVGVPLGVAALTYLDPALIRQAVGVLLIVYSLYVLRNYMLRVARLPQFNLARRTGLVLDTGVGALGGFMGGSTSLNGLFPTIWSGLRGWTKLEQRGVYQPYILLIHAYTLLWLGGVGGIERRTWIEVLWCLPFLALGGYLGLRMFTRATEAGFRKILLGLFLLSGVVLVLGL